MSDERRADDSSEKVPDQQVSRHDWHERILAYSAGFVALLALGVSIWQGNLAREHNRLSVRPILTVGESWVDSQKTPGIFVYNTGIGPALVKQSTLYLDKTEVGTITLQSWRALLRGSEIWDDIRTNYTSFDPGVSLTANEARNLINISENYRNFVGQFRRVIDKRLSFEICYCSLYEECWRLVFVNATDHVDRAACRNGDLSQ